MCVPLYGVQVSFTSFSQLLFSQQPRSPKKGNVTQSSKIKVLHPSVPGTLFERLEDQLVRQALKAGASNMCD